MTSIPILLLVGGLIILGFAFGQLAQKMFLPSILGSMIFGALCGVSLLNILSADILKTLSFLNEITLGFVAISIGLELNIGSLKSLGRSIIYIIFSESFVAFLFVFAAIYYLTGDMAMSLIFGALAPASAPAGTVAVIQETKARGPLTRALYAVVGFDDGLAIIIFAFASAFARNILTSEISGKVISIGTLVYAPFREIIVSIIVGVIAGRILASIIRRVKEPADILSVVTAFVLMVCGIASLVHGSLILANMTAGFVVTNFRRRSEVERVARQMVLITPLLFIMFFALAGAKLELSALSTLGVLGIVYILARASGLIIGARFGAVIGKAEDNIRKYLGLGILSQAGVAIGLALIVSHDFHIIGSQHANEIAATVITTVTATSIVFEIIGPILTKYALGKAGEIKVTQQ